MSKRLLGVILAVVWLLLIAIFALGHAAGRTDATPRSAPENWSAGTGALSERTGAAHNVRSPERADTGDSDPGGAPSPAAAKPQPSASAVPVPGLSSWYCLATRSRCTAGYADGLYAAAGPALRVGDWRGSVVTVCADERCVEVTLIDWCACPEDRIMDLYSVAFERLAPLSKGVIQVTVRW